MKKKQNERHLKRAKNRALDFKSKVTVFVLAGMTCHECSFNSENGEKPPNNFTWSISYDPGHKKYSPYCKRYLRPYNFPSDNICHMFEEIENV